MAVTINGTNGVVFNDSSTQNTAATGFGFKNRIINGAMVIDQRNAGASTTPTTNLTYTLDRWVAVLTASSKYSVQQNAGSVTPPAGYSNYLGVTSLSAYSVGAGDLFGINQRIEGFNTSDLGFGTASAATVTLSFWVRSSLTGTFGGCLNNSAGNRSYLFTYTISSANTWEQKTVTIAGDTTGTWIGGTNGIGLEVRFGLGAGSTYSGTAGSWTSSSVYQPTGATSVVGTNGATFYITGVQLEKGSTATSFDYRPYSTELALCQRYLPCWNWSSGNDVIGFGYSYATTGTIISVPFTVTPRVSPTGTTVTGISNMTLRNGSNVGGTPTAISLNVSGSFSNASIVVNNTAGTPTLTAGQGAFLFATAAAQIQFTGCEL